MRLLHTSDWHLGKLTDNVSRRPDHECIAAEIVTIARDFAPDLILHTGDLFDAFMPSVEDMRFAAEALDELADVAPVVVLCGNHENPKLFALFNRLRGNDRLRFVDKARPPRVGGILEYPTRDGERIRLAALPFVRNTTYIEDFADPATWSSVYGDNIAFVERVYGEALAEGDIKRDISIFAAHLHVTGAVLARSERTVHIDDYATRPEAIPIVTYAAFGHIHKPQDIGGRGWARYAGSPLQIDFGEVGERKSIVLVEAKPGGNVRRELAELRGGRPLRQVRGTLDAIATQSDGLAGSLARVTVEHSGALRLMFERVAELLPETTLLRVDVLDPNRHVEAVEPASGAVEADLGELFGAYVSEHGNAAADNKRVVAVFNDALRATRAQQHLTFVELDDGALARAAAG